MGDYTIDNIYTFTGEKFENLKAWIYNFRSRRLKVFRCARKNGDRTVPGTEMPVSPQPHWLHL